MKIHKCVLVVATSLCLLVGFAQAKDLTERVEHGYADNEGIKIHYVTIGEGPLVVLLHGYPDYWYTWRHQMASLADDYKVVAIDLRGYNRSDKPKGVDNYTMRNLVRDVVAVVNHVGRKKATIIGHDWGGAIAWQVAINRPEMVSRLIVLSTPHPSGLRRELSNNKEQKKSTQYARDYQHAQAHLGLTAEGLAAWVSDVEARPRYIEAFERSDFEAMLNYYKASFPKKPQSQDATSAAPKRPYPAIRCPVLGIFGLQDKALLPAGWNGTWEWIDNDLTLVAVPQAGHFVQADASGFVTKTIATWLQARDNFSE